MFAPTGVGVPLGSENADPTNFHPTPTTGETRHAMTWQEGLQAAEYVPLAAAVLLAAKAIADQFDEGEEEVDQ